MAISFLNSNTISKALMVESAIILFFIFSFPAVILAATIELPSTDTLIELIKDQGVSVSLIAFGAWFFTTKFWPYYTKLNDRRVEAFTNLSESHVKIEALSTSLLSEISETNKSIHQVAGILQEIDIKFDSKINELVQETKRDLTDIILTQNERYSTLPEMIASEVKHEIQKDHNKCPYKEAVHAGA